MPQAHGHPLGEIRTTEQQQAKQGSCVPAAINKQQQLHQQYESQGNNPRVTGKEKRRCTRLITSPVVSLLTMKSTLCICSDIYNTHSAL
jgi:hypothetical protein